MSSKWPFGDYAEPPPELVWLYSHCKALGMDCKSDSGKMEHDIALFVVNLTAERDALKKVGADSAAIVVSNVEFSGTPAASSPEAPLERRVGPGAQEK